MNIKNKINLIKQHKEKFNKEPNIIGMFWSDIKQLEDNLKKSIEATLQYNEYELCYIPRLNRTKHYQCKRL